MNHRELVLKTRNNEETLGSLMIKKFIADTMCFLSCDGKIMQSGRNRLKTLEFWKAYKKCISIF